MWTDGTDVISDMFVAEGAERPIDCMYFDIPALHTDSEEGVDFIRAVASSKDTSLLKYRAL